MHQQIRCYLSEMIRQRKAMGNLRLPSERELAALLKCTRVTLRDALVRIENDGIVYRLNRNGWFITPERLCYDPSKPSSFSEYVHGQGRTPRTELLSLRRDACGERLALLFGLGAASDTVWFVERRRLVDGYPVLLEKNVLSPRWCPQLNQEAVETSITRHVNEQYGRKLAHSSIELVCTTIDPAQAELLCARSGATALRLQRICYAEDGMAVEYDEEIWRSDLVNIALKI